MRLRLERMSAETAAAILEGKRPKDVRLAEDYPTEFSQGVAAQVVSGSDLGPYVIYAPTEPIVVGEIGGAFTSMDTVEIGYALVRSHWGRGIATAAVRAFVDRIRHRSDVQRVVAHTPLDRPESARVVQKAGFMFVGELEDIHEGVILKVQEWELLLGSS